MSFHDHFSHDSQSYKSARPTYPNELFEWLAAVSPTRERAWDCACGNGQASVPLAMHFSEVIATDASRAQIEAAEQAENVNYQVAPADRSGLQQASIDLVTVAQAAHWFDHEAFHTEAMRVLKPGGVLAVWCYGLHRVTPAIDDTIDRFYTEIVGPYWPPERAHVDENYTNLPFPFPKMATPTLAMSHEWTIDQMLAYLDTWSSVKEYRQANRADPIDLIRDSLAETWGGGTQEVTWPLTVICGRSS